MGFRQVACGSENTEPVDCPTVEGEGRSPGD